MANKSPGDGQDATMRDYASGLKLFRRYTLKRMLGRGGMGVVWLARDEELERDVALKFLPDLLIHDRAVLGDLKRETRRSLELTHKNIVRIYDFVHDETSGCISMEYVDGDTLSNLRVDKPHKIFEPEDLKEWMSQLCDALDYAHNHAKIVHRDLKPSNLMINQRGELKVADFGIARSLSDSMSMLTMDQGKSGTLLYMSPQQLDGERGSHLDDIYSLGAAVYELLTSKPPFYSGNVDRQIHEKIPPLMSARRRELEVSSEPVDDTWEEVVRHCLAKDPAKRPQSVSEVAKMLSVPSPKTRRAKPRTPAEAPDLKPVIMGVAAAVGCLVLVTAGWFAYRITQKPATEKAPATLTTVAPALPSPATPPPAPVTNSGLTIDTSPSGADVTINGRQTGKTPLTLRNLQAGKYDVRLALDGYQTVEKQFDLKQDESLELEPIILVAGKAVIDMSSTPPGAKVYQNGDFVGKTPLHRDDLSAGDTTFRVILDGHLPREVKANLKPQQTLKRDLTLTPIAPAYAGNIRLQNDTKSAARPISIVLSPDLNSGTMTQGSQNGDFVVKFNGVWEGSIMRDVTGDVVSQPSGVRWAPESFSLRFAENAKSATYECNAAGGKYVADLSAQSAVPVAKRPSTYKGTIQPGNVPIAINLDADRKSGIMTQNSKSGAVVVKFTAVGDNALLRAVTDDVVSKPENVKWEPESFTLRFDESGKKATYECNSSGKTYSAELKAP